MWSEKRNCLLEFYGILHVTIENIRKQIIPAVNFAIWLAIANLRKLLDMESMQFMIHVTLNWCPLFMSLFNYDFKITYIRFIARLSQKSSSGMAYKTSHFEGANPVYIRTVNVHALRWNGTSKNKAGTSKNKAEISRKLNLTEYPWFLNIAFVCIHACVCACTLCAYMCVSVIWTIQLFKQILQLLCGSYSWYC